MMVRGARKKSNNPIYVKSRLLDQTYWSYASLATVLVNIYLDILRYYYMIKTSSWKLYIFLKFDLTLYNFNGIIFLRSNCVFIAY